MSVLGQQLFINTRDVFNQEGSLPQQNIIVNPSGSAVASANLTTASQTINILGSAVFPAVPPGASAILNLQGNITSNGSANVGAADAIQINFGFGTDLTTTFSAITTVIPYYAGASSIGTSAPRGINLIVFNGTGVSASPTLTATTTSSWTTNASIVFNTTSCECFVNLL
jgi:hypothetical protein